jgi:HTH-type transcriptional regulator/antitoxin HigA
MNERVYTIIRSEEQYKRYCHLHEEIACSGREGQDVEDKLELLYMLISRYDEEYVHHPKTEYDPIEKLQHLLDVNGMDMVDLANLLGVDEVYAADILGYKRGLSAENILIISNRFKMKSEAFNKPYKLQSEYNQYLEDSSVMNTVKDLPKTETYEWKFNGPIKLSFIDSLLLGVWESSFNTNKNVRRVIHFLLKIPPKSYLKTNGYLCKGFIYKHETALKAVRSESFRKLKEGRGPIDKRLSILFINHIISLRFFQFAFAIYYFLCSRSQMQTEDKIRILTWNSWSIRKSIFCKKCVPGFN